MLGSGQQTNEAAYLLGKLARGAIGTRNYDANTTLCMASAVTAYYDAFGSDGPPPTYVDIDEADVHLIWGTNPAAAHPVLFRWIRQQSDDSRLIVVDPVEALDIGVGDGIGESPSFIDWVHQRVPADEAPVVIKKLVEGYAAHREEGQSFRDWVGETGTETLVELAEPEESSYEDPWMYDAKGSWYPFDDGESPAPTTPDGTPLSADD